MERNEILQRVLALLKDKAANLSNTEMLNDTKLSAEDETLDWDLLGSAISKSQRNETITFTALIISLYAVIVLISLLGNIFVCRQVYENNKMKKTVTNIFIFNMAVSDLLMTGLNIPFSLARILLHNWPFGKAMCLFVPGVQVTSVYVSTFTMTCIAFDRYQAIMHPLKPRLFMKHGPAVVVIIWTISTLLSLPNVLYNDVTLQYSYRKMTRCITEYPSAGHRKWISVYTFIVQYLLPVMFVTVAYVRIMHRLWYSKMLGAVTEDQAKSRNRARKKTITMLMTVVVVFAICWLPLNLYHVINDINPNLNGSSTSYNSSYFFACHVLAMSSVCYNPFIYCTLNEKFNRAARIAFAALLRPCCKSSNSRQSTPFSIRRNRPSTNSTRTDAITIM